MGHSQRRPIESFFGPRKKALYASSSVHEDAAPPAVPKELSTGLQAGVVGQKMHVIPRESLPGAWKDLGSEEDGGLSLQPTHRTRVSCVDLSGD